MNITVENLTRKYGTQKAVDNISFHVRTGEVLGFLGPNGAGKTTTMKIITGLLSPNNGDVTVGNYSVLKEPEKVKQLIGFLPENNPLYPDMGVIDYLAYSARLQGIAEKKIKPRIAEMIRVCGLAIEKHKQIGELSKGYRQRVGLAQAMIHDPKVLILDEPTTGLDPNQIVEIRRLIKELGKEKTVILSTHILPEVEATCDRILIINKGKIVADGTSDSLRKQATGRELLRVRIEDADRDRAFMELHSLETVALVDPLPGTSNYFEIQSHENVSSRRTIFNLCVEKGYTLTEMTPVETKLEDLFRDLTLN
ncbi:MAG: ATP-binding cassette domain-containing protein [Bacteroidia bacterium]|nr:ATP-binding cassette domain-containing protein [Bacteroidia bacterium]MCZ2277113.1 ATP-binding cassette domain-containing protein [Bacteroidia bacterium]